MTATKIETKLIGRTVHYTGDACNAPRDGYVADVYADRWGTHAVIAWDDAGEIGIGNATTTISAHMIAAAPKPGERFHLVDEAAA
jgi:hypothetical protein